MANPFTPEQISQILEEFFKVVGTRQYIGARYVPIFGRKDEESIEWDNSAPYEPLTIVLYQGNSYTSRQYVPVGVEITNQEFWALTGNYNAQVEQYRRDVQAFDGRISANATAIDVEKTRAENAEQTLQDGINTNATAIDSEKTRAKNAEKTLQANIDTEKTRAKGAEQTLQTNIDKRVIFCDTVSSLQNLNAKIGDVIITKGFYNVNDGGSAQYAVVERKQSDNMFTFDCGMYSAILNTIEYNALQLGFKQNDDNFDNTLLFSTYLAKTRHKLYFPAGKYIFKTPSPNMRINITGAPRSITSIDANEGTTFYYKGDDSFINLKEQSCISNITIIGDSYNLTLDRDRCAKDVDVTNETYNRKQTAITIVEPAYGTTIANCVIKYFYNAIKGATFCIIENNNINQANQGVSIISDCSVLNNRFFNVMVGIDIKGSNNIIDNNRGDSIGKNMVYCIGSHNIITNLNADYCQYNAVYLFNAIGCVIKNIESRCGTIYPFDSASDGNKEAWSPDEHYKDIAVIGIGGYASAYNYIEVSNYPRNPLDKKSNLLCGFFGVGVEHACYNLTLNALKSQNRGSTPAAYILYNGINIGMNNSISLDYCKVGNTIGYTEGAVSTTSDIYIIKGAK